MRYDLLDSYSFLGIDFSSHTPVVKYRLRSNPLPSLPCGIGPVSVDLFLNNCRILMVKFKFLRQKTHKRIWELIYFTRLLWFLCFFFCMQHCYSITSFSNALISYPKGITTQSCLFQLHSIVFCTLCTERILFVFLVRKKNFLRIFPIAFVRKGNI